MITTNLYLDSRYRDRDDIEVPVKIQINRRSKTALLSTGVKILPSQWDRAAKKIVRHPRRQVLNSYLAAMKLKVDDMLRDLQISGEAADMTVTEIKNRIQDSFLGTDDGIKLAEVVEAYKATKTPGTAKIVYFNWKSVLMYDENIGSRPIRQIRREWVRGLDAWLTDKYAGNTRRQILSTMIGVFNYAREKKYITESPFTGVNTAPVATRKRNLTQAQFRQFWNAECESQREQEALDFFKFSFLLIAANPADIYIMSPENVFNGRIEYDRAKTKKHYSVKVVPELEPLLEKYGSKRRLFDCTRTYKDRMTMLSSYNTLLYKISRRLGLPDVTMYWARHSWATFADTLGIPLDVISDALGHSYGARVTQVYLNKSSRKVDEANRRVIDFALYDEIKEQ